MLVLTRRAGESLCIGDGVRITVLEVAGEKVRIGIDAPRSVSVVRSELVDAAESVNREAAAPAVDLAALARALSEGFPQGEKNENGG